MISASEARELILREISAFGSETVLLRESLGRTLFHPVIAPLCLPPFDNSAMDGFAVMAQENPARFEIVKTIAAGDDVTSVRIDPGQAMRIMTGAPIPYGADAVIPFEDTQWDEKTVFISEPVNMGENIRRAGEDVVKESKIFKSGEKITSRTIALLAAMGIHKVDVFRNPRVALLSTGSELIDIAGRSQGSPLQPGQIYNSNGPALEMALQELGISATVLKTANDTEESLEKSLQDHWETDVWITVGAVSAGDFDLVPKVLENLGAKIIFHKVAIKPGKPFLFAVWNKTLVFALPGNPVSALVIFDQFVRPALLKMMGSCSPFRVRKIAIATENLKGSEGKEDYLRGIAEYRDEKYYVRSAGSQGSARLLPLVLANVTIIIPASIKKIEAGEKVEIEFFGEGV